MPYDICDLRARSTPRVLFVGVECFDAPRRAWNHCKWGDCAVVGSQGSGGCWTHRCRSSWFIAGFYSLFCRSLTLQERSMVCYWLHARGRGVMVNGLLRTAFQFRLSCMKCGDHGDKEGLCRGVMPRGNSCSHDQLQCQLSPNFHRHPICF